jgi:hypothetical protein
VHPVSDFYHIIRLIFAFILKKKTCHVRKKWDDWTLPVRNT